MFVHGLFAVHQDFETAGLLAGAEDNEGIAWVEGILTAGCVKIDPRRDY